MSKSHDPQWENALTVVQDVHPPFIPEGADVMTVVIEYPPGSAGAPAAPASERPGVRLHAGRRDAL